MSEYRPLLLKQLWNLNQVLTFRLTPDQSMARFQISFKSEIMRHIYLLMSMSADFWSSPAAAGGPNRVMTADDTKRKTQAGKESRDETKTLHFC